MAHGVAKNRQSVPDKHSNVCMHAKSLQSCPTLCDRRDGSPPGSSAHGIFQARVLEWGAVAFSMAMYTGRQMCARLQGY